MGTDDSRSKFNVDKNQEKRTFQGIVFDSMAELKYYRDVILPGLGSGEILECKLQEPYILQEKFMHDGKAVRAIKYVADFVLRYSDGREEVIDIKGLADAAARLKRKLFWHAFPDLTYRWVSWSAQDGGWIDYDELEQLKRDRRRLKAKL